MDYKVVSYPMVLLESREGVGRLVRRLLRDICAGHRIER